MNLGHARVLQVPSASSRRTCRRRWRSRLDVPMPALAVVLPVGISFYTFQTLSYTIECTAARSARRDFSTSRRSSRSFRSSSPGRSSGPRHLLPQFEQPRAFDRGRRARGRACSCLGLLQEAGDRRHGGGHRNKVFALAGARRPRALGRRLRVRDPDLLATSRPTRDIARGTARWFGLT